jgi:hypothetical protein
VTLMRSFLRENGSNAGRLGRFVRCEPRVDLDDSRRLGSANRVRWHFVGGEVVMAAARDGVHDGPGGRRFHGPAQGLLPGWS